MIDLRSELVIEVILKKICCGLNANSFILSVISIWVHTGNFVKRLF